MSCIGIICALARSRSVRAEGVVFCIGIVCALVRSLSLIGLDIAFDDGVRLSTSLLGAVGWVAEIGTLFFNLSLRDAFTVLGT